MSAKFKAISEGEEIAGVENGSCYEHRQPPKVIQFSVNEVRRIFRGKCLSHYDNYIIYIGMDLKTGELFTVKEWIFYNMTPEQKQKIAEHLNSLIQLQHPNLAKLLSFTCEDASMEKKSVFYILQEFIFGANCYSLLLNKNIPVQIDMIKHIASGVLNALEFLNQNNIFQANLTYSSFYMDNSGEIKLTNYEIDETLVGCVPAQTESCNNNIYNFGVLILSLIQGSTVGSGDIEIPKAIPAVLNEFLLQCLANHNKKQLTVTELLNHSFIQNSCCNEFGCVEILEAEDNFQKPETLERSQSRVETDFEILESLGKGGFGKVYKAKKKLDGRIYALKKIKLNPNDDKLNNKLIREVQYLSMLNHENIVRYYNSWSDVENTADSDEETDSTSFEDSYDKVEINNFEHLYLESPSAELSDYYEEYNIITNADDRNERNSEDSTAPLTTVDDNILLMEHSAKKILYIQMEFCEGKTLRTVIDSNDLHRDITRIWKFLREIVEGLVHIHEKGIIHRDLKPMNIFMDSNDHIKIGDFGLATTNIRYKKEILYKNKQENELSTAHGKTASGSSTSHVGTGLYKAPEISSCARICDEKLDMYSLGIILFEMCYGRPNTESERVKVLTNLRLKDIVFPDDFYKPLLDKQRKIIRDLLNHDQLKRPTSYELLKSKQIPPILQEEKLKETFKHVVENPHLKLHKYLMECCFTYSSSSNNNYNSFGYKNTSKLDFIKENLIRIFKIHGGQNLSMSTVMPQNSCYSDCASCVKLMTRSGEIVSIPCNTRIPFIRYISMNKNVTWLRRFSIEKIPTRPPRQTEEIYEAAFDIITPINLRESKNFLPDAEILKILNEIKNSFSVLVHEPFCIRLNHSLLIKAIFLEYGIVHNQDYPDIIKILKWFRGRMKEKYLRNYLSIEVSAKLFELLEMQIYEYFVPLNILDYFKETKAREMAKIALEELSCIIATARQLGVQCNIRITPGLMRNFEQHTGMFFEFVCSKKNEHMLAMGGRYDGIISEFQNSLRERCFLWKSRLYGVGILISLKTLCEILEFEKGGKNVDVIVCTFNKKAILNETAKVLRELWSAGISCSFIKATKKRLQNLCKKYNIVYAIILTVEEMKKGIITVGEFQNRWTVFLEKQVAIQEVVATLKILRKRGQIERIQPRVDVPIIFQTSDTLSLFNTMHQKFQIRSQTDILRQRLCGNTLIMVLSIDINTITKLISTVKFNSLDTYELSLERYHLTRDCKQQRNYLNSICKRIYQEKLKYGDLNLILYSLSESLFVLHAL